VEFNENKSARVVVKKKTKKQNLGTFVRGLLRRGSFHWKARQEALVNARVERGRYKCASCEDLFGPKEVDLDHRYPVIDPKVGFTTWDDYINRLFCGAEDFDVLCKACHEAKTKMEDIMREHFKTQKEEMPDLTQDKKYRKGKSKKNEN
jgi:hypothetical protein